MQHPRAKKKLANKKFRTFVLICFLLLVVVSYFYFFNTGTIKKESETPSVRSSALKGEDIKKVKLFFSSRDGEHLIPVTREIIAESNDVQERARRAMMELIDGPGESGVATLPDSTKIRGFYIDDKGLAYIDFSREIRENHPKGVWTEALTVYSIANTLIFNFPEIKSVRILIEGEEVEDLAGHIDVGKPLTEYISIVKFD
jgi:spore germination protein GerM